MYYHFQFSVSLSLLFHLFIYYIIFLLTNGRLTSWKNNNKKSSKETNNTIKEMLCWRNIWSFYCYLLLKLYLEWERWTVDKIIRTLFPIFWIGHGTPLFPLVAWMCYIIDIQKNKSCSVQSQLQFVLKLFLVLEEFQPQCSYRAVLL